MSLTLGDIFWLFIMFSALQPWLRQRMQDALRMRKIGQLERERDSRVILLMHRQETMRFLGFPLVRCIDVNDSEEVLRAIQMTGDDVPLDIVLHTLGGLVVAALQSGAGLIISGWNRWSSAIRFSVPQSSSGSNSPRRPKRSHSRPPSMERSSLTEFSAH